MAFVIQTNQLSKALATENNFQMDNQSLTCPIVLWIVSNGEYHKCSFPYTILMLSLTDGKLIITEIKSTLFIEQL